MVKARHCEDCAKLEQIPNVGTAMAADLRLLGIEQPKQLKGRSAFALYQQLYAATAQRHDPCVLDTLMSAVDFMNGAPAKPWWHYTAQRKAEFGQL